MCMSVYKYTQSQNDFYHWALMILDIYYDVYRHGCMHACMHACMHVCVAEGYAAARCGHDVYTGSTDRQVVHTGATYET